MMQNYNFFNNCSYTHTFFEQFTAFVPLKSPFILKKILKHDILFIIYFNFATINI